MICYVVIDTNVLVSSLLSKYDNAATVRVIDKLFSGDIISIYSKEILSLLIDFGGVAIAIAAAALSHLVLKAAKIREEAEGII